MRFQLAAAARNSRRVITDSLCSKQDLMRIYGLPDEKISVIYLGYDREHYNTSSPWIERHAQALLASTESTRPYILHHGVLQPRKNLKRLVQAYRLMLARNRQIDVDLVLAGPLGWLYSEVLDEIKSDSASRGRVILPGALSDADLAILIKKSTLGGHSITLRGILPADGGSHGLRYSYRCCSHLMSAGNLRQARCAILIRSPLTPSPFAWKRCLRIPLCNAIFPSKGWRGRRN